MSNLAHSFCCPSIFQVLSSMKIRLILQDLHKYILHLPLMIYLCYFVSLSCIGFLALKTLKPKYDVINSPQNLDLLFMSVSASTVSSMGTIEMEVFSNSQLWVLIILMLFGGEVFTSMLDLQLMKARFKRTGWIKEKSESISTDPEEEKTESISTDPEAPRSEVNLSDTHTLDKEYLEYDAIRYLASIVVSYLAGVIIIGSILISLYMRFVPSAIEVLERKGIKLSTFSIFMVTSSFTNCGFTPTNENMMSFKKNSILQLLIIPIVLAGNTMFPPCLRSLTWILKKLTKCKHYSYILQNSRSIGYQHLFTYENSAYLASTVFVFIVMQVVLFCSLEWNSETLKEMNPFQKLVGALFQSVNARHAGESIIDMSTVSPAVLVLCMVMMYLPSYTRYLPFKDDSKPSANDKECNGRSLFSKGAIMSPLCFLVTFIILICITEKRAIIEDPLNFNVLNIAFEVISAYGNVGLSLGYSCKRLLKPDSSCKEAWYGFVGRWSSKGKLILVLVMLYGRLKRFSMNGGKAWKLS